MTGRGSLFAALAAVGIVAFAGLATMLGDDLGALSGGSAAADTPSNQRTITVTAEGQATVVPDTAQVTLGVEIRNPDLATAQSEATQKMTAVIDSLKRNGIDEKQIRTVNYAISIERDYQKPDQPITGYVVTNIVQAKVKPMDKVGTVIGDAVSAGANAVQGVSFAVENIEDAARQARQQAMQHARDKAEQLAQLGNVTLGQPVSITENTSTSPIPVTAGAAARSMPAAAPDLAPPIQVGESTVTISVTVSYAI